MKLFILPAILAAAIVLPLLLLCRRATSRQSAKRRIIFNLCSFAAVCGIMLMVPLAAFAAPEEAAGAAAAGAQGWGYIAAALATGMSSLGAGIAVAAAAPAAIGAFSEDPKAFGKSLIFVALGEGVAIYGLLISILILNNL